MNYQRIYNELINNAKIKNTLPNKYYELHHIIPKSIGGNNDDDNLVKLTLREHYVAHKLLAEIYKTNKSIWYAYWMMMISTLGALEHIKNENYYRIDGQKNFRIKPILDGEHIYISSHEYEYCREYWKKLIKGIKRTPEQCKTISDATKSAMHKSEVIKKCRANKGSKYYHEIKTGKVHKWFPGQPDIDLDKYAWGRGHLSDEQKKKLSNTQRLDKTLCKIGNSNYRYCYYKDYINCVPDCFIDMHQKQNNYLKQIQKYINNSLTYLKDNNIFIDNYIKFYPYKHHGFVIISPAVYEVCLDLIESNNLDSEILGQRIYDNINKIKQLNNIYINQNLLYS